MAISLPPLSAGAEFKFSLKRVIGAATSDPKWSSNKKSLSEKLILIRSHALRNSVVSDPVSDRYVVTCYGGTIDLVHFFMLAAEVSSGRQKPSPRLYREWVAEGGPENLKGFNYTSPPEAHPDDLPSNALGALFGYEIQRHERNPSYNLPAAILQFFAPLKPVPDKIAKEFSHAEIVMGLTKTSSRAEKDARKSWFKAAPLTHGQQINAVATKILGKPFASIPQNGSHALQKAGFSIQKYRNRAIVITRTPSPK